PIYACLCAQFANNFSSTFIQTFLPTYFRDELMISLSMNGLYTMISSVVQIFTRTGCCIVSDRLKQKGVLNVTSSAKIFQSLCGAGIAISLLCLAFLPSCDKSWIAAICLIFYGITCSFGIPGYNTALMSISPQYSGTLSSMMLLSGTLASISSPMLMSLL
ncbi:hypothetical protein PENTCL1PPCAC_16980, partial [Pristionchus entomophagus]